MASLKRLASETAIYGLSTILARVVNFMLVPLYTRKLTTDDMGISGELLAYVALLQVVLTFGMETGFFRFASKSKDPMLAFSTSLTWVSLISILFFVFSSMFSLPIAEWFGRPEDSMLVVLIAAAVCSDSITSILFARLRLEHKAVKFAVFRTIKIGTELAVNLLLFLVMPYYFSHHPDSALAKLISPTPHYSYIIISIFVSSMVAMLLFVPSLLTAKLRFSFPLWKQMMLYSIPLVIAGLPGVANDFIDRILFRYLVPQPPSWESQLGIFVANAKLAVIMSLFVQMFRYAAEPFFFSTAEEANIRKTYALVMKYFSIFCIFIFLAIATNIDFVGYLIGKDFREGIDIVPIMLMSYILLGISFNLSMCFKLSEKTHYAIYVTFAGLLVTLVVNVAFMPIIGYYAAAWAHLLSYLVMVILSWLIGRKVYPIPYDWKSILTYFAVGTALFFAYRLLEDGLHIALKLLLSVAFMAIFAVFFLKREKINLRAVAQKIRKK